MKTILITGASSGIGKACALAAAQNDYRVLACYRKEADGEMLNKLHKNIIATKLDITNEDDQKHVIDTILKDYGKLDCLFNNAGISASGSAEFQSIETYRNLMEVNFISQVSLTQKAIPLLRKSDDARILFTSSASGLFAKPMMASYSASKFALEAFVDTIRVELAPWNIKVAAFEPGKVKTEIYKKASDEIKKQKEQMSPEEMKLYKPLIDVAFYNIENADSMSSDVSEVVEVFMHALTSQNPKTRYPVGGDAKSQAFVSKYFPDKALDWIINRKMSNFLKKAKQ